METPPGSFLERRTFAGLMAGGTRIRFHVHPGASREAVRYEPLRGGFVVYVRPRAEQGEANRAFLQAVSAWLGVPRSSVRLLHGARGREKLVEVDARTAAEVDRLLRRVAVTSARRPGPPSKGQA